MIFSQILNEPHSLRVLARGFRTFNKGIDLIFFNFFLIQSELTVVVNDVVDDKGVALINGAVDGELKFFVKGSFFEFV